VRYAQSAAQALRSPVEVYEPAQLSFDAGDDGAASIAAPFGWGDLRAAGFRPGKFELPGLGPPDQLDVAGVDGQRAIFRCVCRKFMQRESNGRVGRRWGQTEWP